ncbi:MAG: NAD(P)-dependent oxidoreductase [Fimbriimonas sp.]
MARIGFVGLGVMGAPMAGHLLASGHTVTVWNRTAAKAEPLREKGALVAVDLAELAKDQDAVCLCVTGSEDVRICVTAMAPFLSANALVIDHSTIAPAAVQEIAALVPRFVDAPVTGGSMGAQKGQLTVFLGGTVQDCADAQSIIAPYTKRSERVGDASAGQKMKLANQIAGGIAVLALSECVAFAVKAGLDPAQAIDMIGSGAGGSWAFTNYGPKLLAHDNSPGFSIANQRKDFCYVLETGLEIGASLEGTALVDRLLGVIQDQSYGDLATVSLYESLLGEAITE